MERSLIFLVGLVAAALITPAVSLVARRSGTVDRPRGARKLHRRPTPLLGGVAVFLSLIVAVAVARGLGWLPGDYIRDKYLIGMSLAALLLVFGGALDDRYDLRPSRQIVWPILATLVIIGSGIGVTYITNPLGGQIFLDRHVVTVLWWDGLPYKLTLLADIFTAAWLLGMTYTTKFLDGLDGLVSGLAVIGCLIIAAVSLMQEVSQPDTAVLALAVAGAFAGFLVFNFHPARIFLGEGGSTLAGFIIGTLAIIAGGKIATALLVLGVPLLDAGAVILRRLIVERRSPVSGDRSHLHFRLIDLGLTHRQAVLVFYLLALMFGTSTLFLRGWQKLAALGFLVGAAIILLAFVGRTRRSDDRAAGTG